MKKTGYTRRSQGGFTILELLVVISIIAVIATFATGAALKAMKSSRIKRVETMAKGLEIALVNYRAKETTWPFDMSDCVKDPSEADCYWIHGENNVEAFRKMYHGSSGQSKTIYLDAGAYIVTVSGARMTLKEALNKGKTDAAIGYPKPDNPNMFCHYCICYRPLTDTVKIYRQDLNNHKDSSGRDAYCPEWKDKPQ